MTDELDDDGGVLDDVGDDVVVDGAEALVSPATTPDVEVQADSAAAAHPSAAIEVRVRGISGTATP